MKINELKLWEKYSKEVDRINSKRWNDCSKLEKKIESDANKEFKERLEIYKKQYNIYLLELENIKKWDKLPFYKKIFTERPLRPFLPYKPINYYFPSFIMPFLKHKSYENFLDWRIKNKL